MNILVTNDDGVLARGLEVLAEVAAEFGQVTVVAPEVERSGVSHAITLSEPLRLRDVGGGAAGPWPGAGQGQALGGGRAALARWYALSGTPADCGFIGTHHVLGRKPDLVLSGVNRGPNLGYDVLYSGTVGGAMEGVIQGVPAVAFSLVCPGAYPFEAVRPLVRAVVAEVVERGLPERTLLNVNIPSPDLAPFRGFKVTRIGRRYYSNDIVVRTDPRGGEYLWIGGTRVTMEDDPESDCGAVKAGWVSLTPLGPDVMAREAMQGLGRFEALKPAETPVRAGKVRML